MMQGEIPVFHNKTVDRFNQEKLYIQLTRILLEDISSGRWPPGRQIPTEEELCKIYDVSKTTVRQAVSNLVSEGYLMRVQGKGTFVNSALPAIGLAMKTRLTQDMFGKEVNVEREILFSGIREPFADARNYLKTDDKIYYILCRRMVNGEPVYLEESFIPQQLVPGIEQIEKACKSIYSVLQQYCIKRIFKAIQTIEVREVRGDYARNLDIEEGVPVLVVHRLLLSSDNNPIAYTKFLGRSGTYKFQTEFERIR